jgi:hydroxypyruvate reductase
MVAGLSGTVRPRLLLTVGSGDAGHPLPDARSVAAGEQALAIARAAEAGDLLLMLISGGASALLEVPAAGLTIEDLRETVATLLRSGAPIHEINAARRQLSRVKGGQLAEATRASVVTLAISDVVGDDPAVIGSGPTVPAPGSEAHGRCTTKVIGRLRDAIDGAARAASARGYATHVIPEPIVGPARDAGRRLIAEALKVLRDRSGPVCVLAGGETTVTVTGQGRGGRNQECALAMAQALAGLDRHIVAASIGTDGIDGPTDAAGALVDPTTIARGRARGLDPDRHLDDNNSYAFFDALGDLVRTGPTGTNVGDLQIILRRTPNS